MYKWCITTRSYNIQWCIFTSMRHKKISYRIYLYRIHLYNWTEHGKLPSITTGPNTVQNCKLIDLVIRIELTRLIWEPRFSNFLKNSTIHFRMYLYFEMRFPRVMVSLLCRLQAVSKKHIPIYPYLISKGRRNCSTLWPALPRCID